MSQGIFNAIFAKRFDFEKVIFLNIHFFLGIEGYAVKKT